MRRGGKAGIYGPAALVACVAVASLAAQQAQPPGADKVAELFAQARPHLEAALGTKPQRWPQLRLLTAQEFQRLPDPELEAGLRWLFPELKQDAYQRAAEVIRYVAAAATVARHVEGADVIYVLPENLPIIAAWDARLGRVNSPKLLQLALVHEAARFALERQYDLIRRRRDCRDAEEFLALQAMVEGQAACVTAQVARRLGTDSFVPLLAECYLRVPDLAPDPALRTMSQLTLRRRHWAATQGRAFFEQLQGMGLTDAEKRVFTRPPRAVRWVEKPELYVRAEQSNRPDLAAALRALAGTLPAAEWAGTQQPWTPAMVRQVAGLLGESARADRVVSTWDEGRSLVWSLRKDQSKQVAVSVVRHATEAGARAYFGFAVDLQRKQDQLAGGACAPSVRVIDSKATAVNLPGFDEAVRNDKRVQYGPAAEPVPVSTLLARAGDLVVECSWYGLSAEAEWANRVAAEALEACRGGR